MTKDNDSIMDDMASAEYEIRGKDNLMCKTENDLNWKWSPN